MTRATDARKLKADAAEAAAKGKHKKALEKYLELERVEPKDGGWARRAGEMYRQLGRAEEGIAAFRRAADKYRGSGLVTQASAVCQTILRMRPDDDQAKAQLDDLLGAGSGARGGRMGTAPGAAKEPAARASGGAPPIADDAASGGVAQSPPAAQVAGSPAASEEAASVPPPGGARSADPGAQPQREQPQAQSAPQAPQAQSAPQAPQAPQAQSAPQAPQPQAPQAPQAPQVRTQPPRAPQTPQKEDASARVWAGGSAPPPIPSSARAGEERIPHPADEAARESAGPEGGGAPEAPAGEAAPAEVDGVEELDPELVEELSPGEVEAWPESGQGGADWEGEELSLEEEPPPVSQGAAEAAEPVGDALELEVEPGADAPAPEVGPGGWEGEELSLEEEPPPASQGAAEAAEPGGEALELEAEPADDLAAAGFSLDDDDEEGPAYADPGLPAVKGAGGEEGMGEGSRLRADTEPPGDDRAPREPMDTEPPPPPAPSGVDREEILSEFLGSSALFAPFEASEARELADYFDVRELAEGEGVTRAGELSDALAIVVRGELALSESAGERRVGPGAVVGMSSLIAREPEPADARAASPCVILSLPGATFRELIMTHPMLLAQLSEA